MSGYRGQLDDWRKARPGSTQKLSYILKNKSFTDISFKVGSHPNIETIAAHKFMLIMHSKVFEAMIQGPLSSGEDIIEIPDVFPQAFHVLLKFIYTSEFEKDLCTENAISVLYAAKKYDIMDLELVCTDYIKSILSPASAIRIYQAAEVLDVDLLKEEAYAFISRHFDDMSKMEEFNEITLETLKLLLKDDKTCGSELDLFQATFRFAKAQCVREDLEVCALNCRKVAEGAILLIRYPIIQLEDFALQVVPTGLLTSEECTILFQHMVVPLENRNLLVELPFNSKKRSCSIYVAKFYDGLANSEYVDISAGWFNKFIVDQPVSIVSFGFYGPFSAVHASYQVTIKLMTDSQKVLGEVTEQSVDAKMKEIFHVKFPKPIEISPGFCYRAWFSIKGPLTCHGTSSFSNGQEILVPVTYSKYNRVKFTYHVTGAQQLPEIAFQI